MTTRSHAGKGWMPTELPREPLAPPRDAPDDPDAAPVTRENPSKRLKAPQRGDIDWATVSTGVEEEHTSKRLRSPPAGDKATLKYLEESTPRAQLGLALLHAYDLGREGPRIRLRNQRRELRRLNRVIQQMSWKLHRRMRPQIHVALGGLLVGSAFGAIVTIIAVLVFS